MTDLAAMIRGRLQKDMRTRSVVVDDADGALIHWLYENTEVLWPPQTRATAACTSRFGWLPKGSAISTGI